MNKRLPARRRGDLSRELRDFFAHEPGAVQSNYAGIAALALSGVRTDGGNAFGDEAAIARMHRVHRAVGHHKAVHLAMRSISEAHRLALWLAFGPHRLPPEARKVLGETAGAALLTDAAREACKKAAGTEGEPTREQVGAWLLRACIAGEHYTLVSILEERDEIVDAALVAYSVAKRGDGAKPRRTRKPSDGGNFFSPEGYGL